MDDENFEAAADFYMSIPFSCDGDAEKIKQKVEELKTNPGLLRDVVEHLTMEISFAQDAIALLHENARELSLPVGLMNITRKSADIAWWYCDEVRHCVTKLVKRKGVK